jgi:hypothetical protein
MENQINVGIQRQFYEVFEAVDSEAENSGAEASLADDSAGANAGGNPNTVALQIDGESVYPASSETTPTNILLNRYGISDGIIIQRPYYAINNRAAPDPAQICPEQIDPASSGLEQTTSVSAKPIEKAGAAPSANSSIASADVYSHTGVGQDAQGHAKAMSADPHSGRVTDSDFDSGDYDASLAYSQFDSAYEDPVYPPETDFERLSSLPPVDSSGPITSMGNSSGNNFSGSVDTNGFNNASIGDPNSNCLQITGHDANGNPTSAEATFRVTDSYIPSSHGGSPNDYLSVDSYGAIDTETGDTGAGQNTATSSDPGDSAGHGGSFNDYLSVDGYGVGSQTNESTNIDSTQSSGTSGYQGAVDAASHLLGKPQGRVTYDDVLGTLTQIRGASQNPELTMRQQQALNSVFMAVYTRGNTERVIGPTVTNEFLNAAITSMMFGGGNARIPRPTSPTGPMLPGTTGNRTAVTLPGNRASETASLLAAAQQPFRGQTLTNAGRAATKHPEYFGYESTERMRAANRTDAQINALASQSLQEILSNGVRTTGTGGRYPNGWITYTLPDGRAASWQSSGEFIGFRGVNK